MSAIEVERPNLQRHSAPDGTVTVMFTDIEGSTAMTERLGDVQAQGVLRTHNAIIREQVGAHQGFEVKSQGDGFMLAFSSARTALECAIAIQQNFAIHEEADTGSAAATGSRSSMGSGRDSGSGCAGSSIFSSATVSFFALSPLWIHPTLPHVLF